MNKTGATPFSCAIESVTQIEIQQAMEITVIDSGRRKQPQPNISGLCLALNSGLSSGRRCPPSFQPGQHLN